MHSIEIAGHTYVYKNIGQLNLLLERRQEQLSEEDARNTERLLKTRNEKRAIAKYMGIPLNQKESRMALATEEVQTPIAALQRG